MSDKRSVATDALETLGTIIGEGAGRDAIHLAVEPVIASERLLAGQDVYLLPDGRAAKGKDKAVGIVDPFLKESVKAGAFLACRVSSPDHVSSACLVASSLSGGDTPRVSRGDS